MHKERRLKRYYMPESLAIDYLQAMRKWPDIFGRAVITDVPEDAEIESIYWCELRRSFVIHVWHPSFPIVPDGEETPEGMGGHIRYQLAFFVRGEDGAYRCPNDKPAGASEALTKAAEMLSWRQKPSMRESSG